MRLHISTIKDVLRKYIIYKIYNIVLYINLGLFSGRHWLHIGFTLALTVASPSLDRRSTVVQSTLSGGKGTAFLSHMQIFGGEK